MDDYHGWSSSPPTNKDGTAIPGLDEWRRSVTVEWVNPLNVSQVQGSESSAKRVTVTVSYGDVPVASLAAIKTTSGL
ncbi:MAG: hypothetical protein A2Z25_19765 [Planctomycetes bacterium RBG_16_55_9]|nr:MAG: hypothetical protein A2Z25_19765 [Planctomycetes bacterium RBG_16_55_9]